MVDSLSAAVIGVFCADAIVCSVLFIAFFRRRYRQPVKPRQPLIVLFYTAGLQLVPYNIYLQSVSSSCALQVVFTQILTPVLMDCVFMRSVLLFANYRLTRAKSMDPSVAPFFETWLLRHHHIVMAFLKKHMLRCMVLIHITAGTLSCALEGVSDPNCACPVGINVMDAWVYCEVGLFVIVAFNLKTCRDGFGIKRELMYLGMAYVVGIVSTLAVMVFVTSKMVANLYYSVIIWVVEHAVLYIGIVVPLRASYRAVFDRERHAFSLQDILTMPEGLAALSKFLEAEFCIEIVLFYQAVQKFKSEFTLNSNDIDGINRNNLAARRVYDNFVSDNGPLQVNLSSEAQQKLAVEFQSITRRRASEQAGAVQAGDVTSVVVDGAGAGHAQTPNMIKATVFDDAWKELYNAVSLDSFQRFLMTNESRMLLQNG